MSFDHQSIAQKWQARWLAEKVYRTPNNPGHEKYYVLDMFPYPSGAGLHVGHPEGYIGSDIVARYKRMIGVDVLHPMGWDAFGLPAENYAIKTGTHPRATTEANINTFRRQLSSFGFSYDWDRELSTITPDYYRWTQWIFVQLFKKGLAYEAKLPINWCPSCKTGLANEEVVDGKCDRCTTLVERKDLRQWVLKITAYADRLLAGLKTLDWPAKTRLAQEYWIGRSEGAEIMFGIDGLEQKLTVFTTRVDTIFGCTYVVVAPEHPVLKHIVTAEHKEAVDAYVTSTKAKSDMERTELNQDKTGIFTGSFAVNPYTNEYLPIWVADYVLGHYGTGAVMAVPAHDERDFAFAQKYNLAIKSVIKSANGEIVEHPTTETLVVDDGVCFGSGPLDNLSSAAARAKAIEIGEKAGFVQRKVNYRLHDWVFSRQRYWGEPIPVVHCPHCGPVAVPEDQLPLLLPEVEKYEPTGTGESPLAGITDWVNTTCPECGEAAKRETNTMPQWAGSCWYFLRFIDPTNTKVLADYKLLEEFGPVDMYVGGSEHAVLHLLYARFWNMFLFDIGAVPFEEPFQSLRHQGMILGENHQKMSKSRGNVVNPDVIIDQYGADTFRLYEMFMGPFADMKPWSTKSIEGTHRFLQKVWRLADRPMTGEGQGATVLLHKTIKKVGEDIMSFSFNTAISQLMILVNALSEQDALAKADFENLLKLLSPFAPHITEEIWEKIGNKPFLVQESWPQYDSKYLVEAVLEIPVQINGKVREVISVPAEISQADAIALAKEQATVQKWLSEGELVKEIYIPGKMINFVIKPKI